MQNKAFRKNFCKYFTRQNIKIQKERDPNTIQLILKYATKFRMSVTQTAYIKLFQFVCIILVVYSIYEQFIEYLKNEDSSSISFRKFNHEKRDLYPIYSICMHSTKGAILKLPPKDLGNETRLGMSSFHKMLIGIEELHENFNDIDFENNTVDIFNEFFQMFVSFTKQGKEAVSWPGNQKSKSSHSPPFYRSYNDSYFCCITKDVKFTKSQILHYDYLVLNAQKLYNYMKNVSNYDNTTNLFLYVHHPGQLVREFGKQTFQLNQLDFQNAINGTGNYHEIHLSHVEVVRKRFDGIIQCNATLDDEDDMWIQKAISSVKCIPTYWKKTSSDTIKPNLPECNCSTQYANLHKHFLPPNNFESTTKLYKEPCNQMRITLNLLQKDLHNPGSALVLAFNYNTEEYRETLNHRAFGELSRKLILFV